MNGWDFKAPFYSSVRKLWPLNRILRRETVEAKKLLATLPEMQGRALDLGCGSGESLSLLPFDLVIIAMDRSIAMVRRHPCCANGLTVVGDAGQAPFKNSSFVLVSAVGVAEYIPSMDRMLTEIGRITVTKGAALVTCSPKNVYGCLRRWLGPRLYFHRYEAVFAAIKTSGLVPAGLGHLFSQQIILLHKI